MLFHAASMKTNEFRRSSLKKFDRSTFMLECCIFDLVFL